MVVLTVPWTMHHQFSMATQALCLAYTAEAVMSKDQWTMNQLIKIAQMLAKHHALGSAQLCSEAAIANADMWPVPDTSHPGPSPNSRSPMTSGTAADNEHAATQAVQPWVVSGGAMAHPSQMVHV
jgi:hypothetical protein